MASAASRPIPPKSGGYTNIKLYNQSLEQLREMAFKSNKVIGKRMFMNEIASIAIQEYYDRNFKNK